MMVTRALLFLSATDRAPGGTSAVFDSSISLGVSGVAVEESLLTLLTGVLTAGQAVSQSEPMGHVNWSLDGGSSGSVWVGFGPYG